MAVAARTKPTGALLKQITDGIESIGQDLSFSSWSEPSTPEPKAAEMNDDDHSAKELGTPEPSVAENVDSEDDDAVINQLMDEMEKSETEGDIEDEVKDESDDNLDNADAINIDIAADLPPDACIHSPDNDALNPLSDDEMNHELELVASSTPFTVPGYRPCDHSGPVFMPDTDRPRLKVYEIETHGGYDLTTEPDKEDDAKRSGDDLLGGYYMLGSTGLGLGFEVSPSATQSKPDVKINAFTGEEIPTLLELDRRVSAIESRMTDSEPSENHTHHYYLSPGQSTSMIPSSAAAAAATSSSEDSDNALVLFM